MKLAVVVWHQRLQSLSCRDYCSLYVSLAHQEIYPTPFLALRTLMVLISMLTDATDPVSEEGRYCWWCGIWIFYCLFREEALKYLIRRACKRCLRGRTWNKNDGGWWFVYIWIALSSGHTRCLEGKQEKGWCVLPLWCWAEATPIPVITSRLCLSTHVAFYHPFFTKRASFRSLLFCC